MKHPHDGATANGTDDFQPGDAAALLELTTLRARRQFEPSPPWLLVIRAALALIAYGALWLSVRGQDPYLYPTVAVIPVGVAVGAVNVVATTAVAKRASAGIGGRPRLRTAEIVAGTLLWIAVFVVMAAMAGAGVSNRIVYGIYPAAAPLIIAGLAWAAITAVRADWRACAAGLVTAAVGVLAVFAGPVGAWAVAGVGICLVLLVRAGEIHWHQHA